MAKAILNARVYLAEVDLSGVTNAAAINLKTDVVECTAFSDAYKDRLAGLTDVITEVSGFFSASEDALGNPDKKLFNQLALSNAVLTIATASGVTGADAYFFRPTLTEYQPLAGKVSEMASFKLHGEGAAPLVKGQILIPKTDISSNGNGTPYQLGAVLATQKIYCGLHIFAVSGTLPTLDLILQSDALVGFGSPANVITFAQKTAIGQDWQSLAGPLTDDWWRINYTLGGTLPHFTFAVVAGVALID
jgi:hypothetical protein